MFHHHPARIRRFPKFQISAELQFIEKNTSGCVSVCRALTKFKASPTAVNGHRVQYMRFSGGYVRSSFIEFKKRWVNFLGISWQEGETTMSSGEDEVRYNGEYSAMCRCIKRVFRMVQQGWILDGVDLCGWFHLTLPNCSGWGC